MAIGDSFTAGQGAPPYSSETCKQSKWAGYPRIAAAASLGAYKLTANNACSGARIADVPAQLAGADPATALVTLTVGGIDAGSNGVLAACAAGPDTDQCRAAIAASTAAIAALGPQLVGLYNQLAATLPDARIVVLNYPRLFKPGAAPLGELVNAGTDALNAVIAGAVAATGNPKVTLVNVTDEFAGHAIGDKLPYIGFNPADVTAAANFHPNALGNLLGYTRALVSDGVLRR
ncbi:hypothetical protein GY24_11915 [Microterricola pindariensis]|uniref:SGNH hydrolase-type esterase domain-containing protein n=1 Tax=Microterricola pindariensis TaxID=478010 RepID=A0ABX5AV87_9MICO|nr:hypothetical protein GY24_11915 [Microterricola pindariensis]